MRIWPGREEARMLLGQLEYLAPGLTQAVHPETKAVKPLPIHNAMYIRMDNRNQVKRMELEKDLSCK